jgi:DNA mismatch endonuclease (patch repair protein)
MSDSNHSWASSEGVPRSIQSSPTRNTLPEAALPSTLYRAGLRFWKHDRPVKSSRREADVAFTR